MIDIVIIGAGPAGMSAALYALRAGCSVMILESENFGGQISYTPKVENYPGIQEVNGAKFASDLFDQIIRLGAQYDLCKADRIEATEVLKKVESNDGTHKFIKQKLFCVHAGGKKIECKSVVIANGVKPRKLGLAREDELTGEGVCYCAVCDGAFFKGMPVAVYGGGNTALTDVLFLSAYCPKVYLIHRGDAFSAEKPLIDLVFAKNNVEIILKTTVAGLLGDSSLNALQLEGAEGNKTLNVDALFVAAGRIPDNQAFANLVELDKKGFIIADESCKTLTDGIFAAGDCRTKNLRQLVTAAADGAVAGIAAAEYSSRLK